MVDPFQSWERSITTSDFITQFIQTLHLRVWDNKSRSDFRWASAENTLQPSIALWVLLYEAPCLHDLSVTAIKSCLPLVMQNFHLYACEQCYRLQMAEHGRKPKFSIWSCHKMSSRCGSAIFHKLAIAVEKKNPPSHSAMANIWHTASDCYFCIVTVCASFHISLVNEYRHHLQQRISQITLIFR